MDAAEDTRLRRVGPIGLGVGTALCIAAVAYWEWLRHTDEVGLAVAWCFSVLLFVFAYGATIVLRILAAGDRSRATRACAVLVLALAAWQAVAFVVRLLR